LIGLLVCIKMLFLCSLIYKKRVWVESGDVRSPTILYVIWAFLNIRILVRLKCLFVLKWYLCIVW